MLSESVLKQDLLFQGSLIWLIVVSMIAGIVFAFFAYRRTNPQLPFVRRLILFSLRSLAFSVIALFLLDPLWSVRKTEEIEPSVAIVADNSISSGLSDSVLVRDVFSECSSILSKRYKTYLYTFSDTLQDYKKLDFSGLFTGFGNALLGLRDRAKEHNTKAAIIITDGQVNIGDDPQEVAGRLPFPVYTFGIGALTKESNLAIRRIVSNPIAYKDIPTEISVYVEGYSESALKDIPVLLKSGGKVLAESRVNTEGKGQLTEVRFEWTPQDTGRLFLQASVSPLENERITEDNVRSFSFDVMPSKKKLLILYSHLTWDVTFIKRVLTSNPNYDVYTSDCVVL
jgi:hypothetical protein